ncbi:MAG TPA: dTDP-glucose 4,6-dehydratase [Gemmatimonadaceae bacterium]|nr:dTDP-glucose 4,6-dehydratase [Gemmatimonadaceae bacterium]
MADLLVTGGAGFIGANFVHHWLEAERESRVVVLDALTYAGNMASLAPVLDDTRLSFVHGDIVTPGLAARLLREHRLDTVVHFAAESHVDRSIHGPDAFVSTNVLGTHELLKAARQVWLVEQAVPGPHRFHHVSTDEVYGSLGVDDAAFTETTAYAPNSPYSATKAASDHLVRAYHHTYALPVTTSNCSNNYGPYHFPEKLIPLLIVNILEGRPLPVYGDGRNVRDWLYVRDHARAIAAVLQRGRVGEVYNVGGKNEWANIDIVKLVCALVDDFLRADVALRQRFPSSPASSGRSADELITFVTDRPGHDRRYAIDPSKIERELGFLPEETFESGIRRTVEWFLQNEAWWRAVMEGSYRSWIEVNYERSGA